MFDKKASPRRRYDVLSGDPDNYVTELGSSNTLATMIRGELTRVSSPLTPSEVARRALTQSCAGCHEFGFLSTAPECFFLTEPHLLLG